MGDKESTNLWKLLATVLLGMVISGSGFYLTYGQHAISRADANEMIESKINQSEYTKDKLSIKEMLERNNRSVEENTKQITDLKVQTGKLQQKTDDVGEQLRALMHHLKVKDGL